MSAIAKPLCNFTNSAKPDMFVGVDHINTVDTLDVLTLPNEPTSAARYYIVVNYQYPNGETKKTKVPFLAAVDRDASLGNFKTALSLAIA
jgi:hypothetical protein